MKAPEASLGSFLICVHVRGQRSASAPVIVNLQDNREGLAAAAKARVVAQSIFLRISAGYFDSKRALAPGL